MAAPLIPGWRTPYAGPCSAVPTCAVPCRRRPPCARCCPGRTSTWTSCSHQVRPIVAAVRERGVAGGAGVTPSSSTRSARPRCGCRPQDWPRPLDELDPAVRDALAEAIARARKVHADQRRTDVTTAGRAGRHRHRALGAGAPGRPLRAGRAGRLPVQCRDERGAGADRRASARSWCARRRRPSSAACRTRPCWPPAALLGVTEVWAAGGAQAIALLAYGGTDTDGAELDPVDMVTGPGNVYVTAAKRLLRGMVGIDAEAGPTEIAILADHTADPVHVAADLISQAEHDPLAASVLVTTSVRAGRCGRRRAAPARSSATKHTERVTHALTGNQSGCMLVSDCGRRPAGRRTPTRPSTWRSRPRTRATWRPGCATRARCSSARTRRSRSATTALARTTCCPPAAAPGTPPGCPCRPSCAAST